MPRISVSATVTSTDQDTIARAVEAFSRAASGLALEGAETYILIGPEAEPEEPAD